MKTLKPIKDKDVYSDIIFEELKKQIYNKIFKPLFDIIGETKLRNSKNDIINALWSGQIFFNEGKIYGKFNASIGKVLREYGARFNHVDRSYVVDVRLLPIEVRDAIAKSNSKFQEQNDKLLKTISSMNNPPTLSYEDVEPQLTGVFIDLNKQFNATVPSDIGVPMYMSPFIRSQIEKDYLENLNLYITKWYDEDIVKLREQVYQSAQMGYRTNRMAGVLEAQYGVASRKAKFLARQETSLLVSKYRESRYKESGLRRYRWETSHDARVRHDHKELNGKIFSWDNPPITDKHTGQRNNPGEDYNCRCVAVPIVE